MIRFACPSCQAVYKATERDAGRKTECPKCGQRLQVPSPRKRTVLGTLLPAFASPMSPPMPAQTSPPAAIAPAGTTAVQVNIGTSGFMQSGNGLAVAGMVLGIISLPFFCSTWITVSLASLAILLSGAGIWRARQIGGAGHNMAIAGLCMGLVSAGLALAWYVHLQNAAADFRKRNESEQNANPFQNVPDRIR